MEKILVSAASRALGSAAFLGERSTRITQAHFAFNLGFMYNRLPGCSLFKESMLNLPAR